MTAVLACSGELDVTSGVPQCSGQWEAIVQLPPFDPSQLDPIILGQAFGAGFTLVAICMALGMGARAVINSIKNL